MSVKVRNAILSDFVSIYQFINELEGTVFNKEIQENIYKTNLANPDVVYFIAEQNKAAIGFISCHFQYLLHHAEQVGEIQEMFVQEKFRSSGTGKALLHFVLADAKKRNVTLVEVTSNKVREKAHQFYLREGFKATHFKFTIDVK